MLYNKKLVASRLKELRENHAYTMEDIAKKLDMFDRRSYSSYEYGRSNLPLDKAFKLANLYNVSLDYIYGLSNNKDNNNLINTNELDAVLKTGVTYNGKTLTSNDIIALKAFLQGLTSSK